MNKCVFQKIKNKDKAGLQTNQSAKQLYVYLSDRCLVYQCYHFVGLLDSATVSAALQNSTINELFKMSGCTLFFYKSINQITYKYGK